MSFENNLQNVLLKLTLSSSDRESYTKDADEIRDYIINAMKQKNKKFKHWFNGWSLTGSYLDDLKIEQPDEFDIHIKIKLPYSIQIIDAKKFPGYFFLEAVNQSHHGSKLNDPFTVGVIGVSRVLLQEWFREILQSIFKKDGRINLQLKTGKTYQVLYHKSLRGYATAHTFTATDQNDSKREIWFDFVPAFEFGKSDWIGDKNYIVPEMPWFGVPSPRYPPTRHNHFIFMICAPHQEREILKGKNNMNNSLRLLKAVKDHNGMPKLKSYIIKTVFLWEIENQKEEFWEQPIGVLFLHMLGCLIKYIQKGSIPFYWNKKLNLLDRLRSVEKFCYLRRLNEILHRVILTANNYDELRTIFGC